jgi:hypothetical protein
MVIEQFNIQPLISNVAYNILIVLVVIGVVLIVVNLGSVRK